MEDKDKFPEYDEIDGILGEDFSDAIDDNSFAVDKVSDREIKSIEKEVNRISQKNNSPEELGFKYEPKCKCCNFALKDSDLHKVALLNNLKAGPVQKYIEEKYGETVKWDGVNRHIKEHFLPIYDAVSYKRKENLLQIKKWIKEREDSVMPNKLEAMEEMLHQVYENIFIKSSDESNGIAEYAFIGKSLASIANTLLKIQEHRLTLLGNNKSPEEMKKIYTEAVKGLIQRVVGKIEDEEQRKNIISLIQKEFNNGGL